MIGGLKIGAFVRLIFTLIGVTIALISCQPDLNEEEIIPYSEEHRNQFHFSPEANWMNDPNGMVYYEGEYHLFYQYYPDSTVWGPMHWGHAVSENLVHWEHLPIALYPDSLGYIFSGSAVIDWENVSGLGAADGSPPMIAFFTHHNVAGERENRNDFQYQSIAYSHDKGRTWTKYASNPIIANPGIRDFRDPKVVWDGEQWVMVFAAGDRIKFYTSDNLLDWTFSSDFGPGDGAQGRPWECPDLFPLTSPDGNTTKWVLIVSIGKDALNGGSGTQYFIGDWNGSTFVNDYNQKKTLWLDYGKDNYAGVTWSDVHDSDGRRLFIGWMSNWQYAQTVPTERWRSAMTIPRELKLIDSKDGYELQSIPVIELETLTQSSFDLSTTIVNTPHNLLELLENQNGSYRLDLTFERPDTFGIDLVYRNESGKSIAFGFNPMSAKFYVDRTFSGNTSFSKDFAGLHESVPIDYENDELQLTVFIDKASVELFADDGRVVMTEIFFPTDDFTILEILNPSGKTVLKTGRISELQSIWSK